MRFSKTSVVVLLCMGLAGCTSTGSDVDELLARPSLETTSSITPPMNVAPPAEVRPSTPVEAPPQEMALVTPVAAPVMPAPPVRMPPRKLKAEPASFVVPAKPSGTASERSRIYSRRFRDAKPINFGRASSPKALAVHGVDVSRWQGDIDWEKLRSQGANFAYIKATDGGDHLDPMFKTNWRKAHEAGLKRGAYHFFYWCRTAGEQADWFIRNVPKVEGALPPVIDVEWNGESRCSQRISRKRVLEKMQVFMDRLERHYGQRPVIYTAPDFYRDNLRGEFPNHPFWLRAVAEHPSKVYPGRKWLFWQYSGSGLSHGVDGRIDLNAFHGSADEWHRWVATSAS
ncbi:glycoside hydrolase family 25 protein [Phyllobacterium leguminum]|uniref:Lysozyme n=1 Tax=Phyllobacterium leguminum TaxID=314237 RepID=A0A318SXM7_9HYPH|nr:GH25 family lysozyme [Phyllobacterium leguminum]PYE86712.1 lysozyme [Phyllobacterium leguminum]